MNNKKFTLFIVSGVVFTLAISGVVLLDVLSRNSDRSNEIKTPYQLYCESHPQYNKTESEWLNDLINGRLGDKEKYVVSFDSAGGSKVDNQVVFVGEKVVEPEKPTKLGYEFVEWTYKGNPWIFYGFSVDENIVLTAKWSINHYSIDYVLNGGSTEVSNPIEYTVESEFTFESPTREGYGFAGWYDQNNNKFESISKGLTGDLVLTAKWTADKNNLNIISSDSLRGDVEVISGEGFTDEETQAMRDKAVEYGAEKICHWHGQIPNIEVHKLMQESDIFFFTSIFEATSTVILEAIQNGLPIVFFDRCGFGPIVDDSIGMKIPCKSPKQAVRDFVKAITYLYNHREVLPLMSANCKSKRLELSWDNKMTRLMSFYRNLV